MNLNSLKFLLLLTACSETACAETFTFRMNKTDSVLFHQKKNPVEIKFAAHITRKGLHDRLEVLTADSLGGRETGTAGARKASHYIASRFQGFGLEAPVNGSYYFNVPLVEKKFQSVSLIWKGSQAGAHNWSYYPTGRGGGGTTSQTELLVLRLPESADAMETYLAAVPVTDKAVLILTGKYSAQNSSGSVREWLISNNQNLRAILHKNPAAVFITDDFQPGSATLDQAELTRRYAQKGTGFAGSAETDLHNALFVFTHAGMQELLGSAGSSLEALAAIFTAKNPQSVSVPVSISIKLHFSETPAEASDVLGLLPGTDLKKEVLVISAHYDHLGTQDGKIYHGADDDGSGSSALMSLAAAFTDAAKAGHKPRRSILFLANVGEEKGLLGSQYYSEHPVFKPANTITDLNIDMIGRIDSAHMQDSDYVYAIGSGKLSSDLQHISEETNKTYTGLKLDYRFDDPADPNQFYYRSDHYNFAKLNIPIIFYFNGVHADYHQPSDTIEKINFGIYQKRAQLVFYTAWELANRNLRPAVDRTNDFK